MIYRISTKNPSISSPVDSLSFSGKNVYIKRDDLLDARYPGNKYRKLFHFLNRVDLPPLVSMGGNQSNAMAAIAALAHARKIPFTYYTRRIPGWLKEAPSGNYRLALELGARFVELDASEYREAARRLSEGEEFFIPQGGAMEEAEPGVKILAEELELFAEERGIGRLNVFLPSGTGTTALYLARHAGESLKVFTVPCAGDAAYLREQMARLESLPERWPEILVPEKKTPFAKPEKAHLEMYLRLKEAGIEFDLVYGPRCWLEVEKFVRKRPEEEVLVVHTGGVEGNPTQLERYARKGFIRTL